MSATTLGLWFGDLYESEYSLSSENKGVPTCWRRMKGNDGGKGDKIFEFAGVKVLL